MNQEQQISRWAHMLDEAMEDKTLSEVDLSQREGSMSNIIVNQIIQTDALNKCTTK